MPKTFETLLPFFGLPMLCESAPIRLQGLLEGKLRCLMCRSRNLFVADNETGSQVGVLVKPAFDFLCLRIGCTDNHPTDGIVSVRQTEIAEVLVYELAQCLNIIFRFVDI